MIYWFTGQPGSGKTTLAVELIKFIKNTIHIDGDNLRNILSNYDYTPKGRKQNIENVLVLARFLDYKKFNVIISVIAPYKYIRDSLKETNKVIEIYVYTNKIRGREKYFVKEYEPPTENFLSIDTSNLSIEKCINKILRYSNIENNLK
jgi:adenylylsulfate kinase